MYRLQDKSFGKVRGRRLYGNTPTTDNAVQKTYLEACSEWPGIRVALDPSDYFSGFSTCVKGGVAKSNPILFDPGAAGLKTLDSKDWLV
jgi:hypothetical protein